MKRSAIFVTLLASSAFFSSAVVHAATPDECEVLIYGPSGAPLNDASTPMTPVPPGPTPPGGTTPPGSPPTPSPTPPPTPGSSGGSSGAGGRSAERRVGQECVRPCSSRGSRHPEN